MWKTVRRALREGVEFGGCAGMVWLLADLFASVGQRRPMFYSLRTLAAPYIEDVASSAVFLGGIAFYLTVGAVLGVVYCLLNACLSDRMRTRLDRQAAIGLLFGAAVWAVKVHVVTRYMFPAFLADRTFLFTQLVLHTFFFGVPLAIFYAMAERRLQPLMRAMQTTTAQRPAGYATLRGVNVREPHPSLR
jgi:hypothetical protein